METANEVKDNEVLRALIASKKRIDEEANLNSINCNLSSSPINEVLPDDSMDQPAILMSKSDQIGNLNSCLLSSKATGDLNSIKDASVNYTRGNVNVVSLGQDIDSCLLIDEDVLEISAAMYEFPNLNLKSKSSKDMADQKSSIVPGAASDINGRPLTQGSGNRIGLPSSRTVTKDNISGAPVTAEDKPAKLLLDDIELLQPLPQIRKEAPFPTCFAKPGIMWDAI